MSTHTDHDPTALHDDDPATDDRVPANTRLGLRLDPRRVSSEYHYHRPSLHHDDGASLHHHDGTPDDDHGAGDDSTQHHHHDAPVHHYQFVYVIHDDNVDLFDFDHRTHDDLHRAAYDHIYDHPSYDDDDDHGAAHHYDDDHPYNDEHYDHDGPADHYDGATDHVYDDDDSAADYHDINDDDDGAAADEHNYVNIRRADLDNVIRALHEHDLHDGASYDDILHQHLYDLIEHYVLDQHDALDYLDHHDDPA